MRLPISSSARRTFSNISILSASWAFCCRLTPSSRRSCSYIWAKLKWSFQSKRDWLVFGFDTDFLTHPNMPFPFRNHSTCVEINFCLYMSYKGVMVSVFQSTSWWWLKLRSPRFLILDTVVHVLCLTVYGAACVFSYVKTGCISLCSTSILVVFE